ncbi:hypothetical protein LCGC14_1516920 [marine sediment metagenome]|uniref:Terminase large subunit gp17-like C-terminal domain-containing protein n=1 Tax=marine sediment metagenome TaxID=412755 RepID=A0A0F9IZU2_9ZZZZ
MRTYNQVMEDYLIWYSGKTNNNQYLPHKYLAEHLDDEELNIRKAGIWNEILDMCYKPVEGIYWFTKFILGDMTYAGYPNPIKFNNLWWEWSKMSTNGDHIAIKCSRQHGKSTKWTVIEPVYRCSLLEHYNVLISSASEDQAIMLLGHIQTIIDNNEFLSSKKNKNAKWSATEIAYNGGIIRGKGVGSEVRGGTYDYICCDDILRSDNKLSDDDIEKYIDEELEPMILVRNGQLIIVGTPKSETDIFSVIEDRIIESGEGLGWKIYTYPAITNWEKKELLCPDRFTWEQLMAKRNNMGQKKFDKEFMCKTYSSGSQLFPFEFRKRARELGVKWKLYSTAKSQDLKDWLYYIGIDCARAGTAGGDYTVVTVLAYNPKNQEKRIVWIWRKKGLKISEQVEQIAEISRNFNNPILLVEKNNMGQEFIDILVDNYNLNVEEFTTTKGNKYEDLLRYLVIAFENEKIIIPSENQFSREIMQDLDRELERFVVEITKSGNEVMKGSGRSHDDMVISLALANRCSQAYGYSPFAEAIISSKTTALERYAASGDFREVLNFDQFDRGKWNEIEWKDKKPGEVEKNVTNINNKQPPARVVNGEKVYNHG